ncbi:ninein [Tachyglossus aculeatus]|uniref:ninein n=1 Tax=Tachyglossus aculeatus TaxID=9261 RepID=UPI0018F3014E|nr:ninein [Tachyglossus aculeatus]
MDEAEQDQHEARLKELFDSFDSTGTGSLGQEELTDLCHVLNLEEVAPALQQTLFRDNLLGRVHFDQFKEALILILSRTLSNEEHFQEPDCSPEAQPKYIKGGKRYGRRSLPEFQESVEDFAEVTVIEPLNEEARASHIPSSDRREHWKTQHSEEYEAEGQLRFWNPDDLTAAQSVSPPAQDWIEEKLREVCEDLGITRDGHLNKKKLVSICEQYGLQAVDREMLEDVFHNLEPDGTMSVEDFFYGLFKNGKALTPSASTPYRQLKRHLSMQSFDESGRRTTTPSAMTSTIGFRVFSCLDDGMGYASVERILDTWHEEGIENSQEILKALDFSLDGNVNLTELTLALENELLITKNGIHQAALASFKTEIRHLLERVDQVAREKEKLRLDLEKAERLKSLMASEVDDHHAAIERRNEYNLRKLDEEYKERTAALKSELRREREQIQQQVSKQRLELEQEVEKVKIEENYIRDRLALSLKENSRLERELIENAEKLAEYESLTTKLQRNLENVLTEKFGGLDPSSAEFLLQEERLTQMKNEYEQQCRLLQDQVDELQSELEEYRAQGKVFRLPVNNSLADELDIQRGVMEPDRGLGSEDCNPLNMSIEAELVIEQMKEQHRRDLHNLKQELEDQVSQYEKQIDATKTTCEREQELVKQQCEDRVHSVEKQLSGLKNEIAKLQGEAVVLKEEQQRADCRHADEKNQLRMRFDEEKASLQELLNLEHEVTLKSRLEELEEGFNREREGLIQSGVWAEEKMRSLVQAVEGEKRELEQLYHEQLQSLAEKHLLEKEELQRELQEKHQSQLQEERRKMETEHSRRTSVIEAQFLANCQRVTSKHEEVLSQLKECHRQELKDLTEQHFEEKSRWEFEKEEITRKRAEALEHLKETLEREKATSLVLTQEKELLEKKYKESLNSLFVEKEQVQKEVEELRSMAERQRSQLSNEILELQNSHVRELKDREQIMSEIEGTGKRACQRLKELQVEYERERQEMTSKLLALEDVNKEALEKMGREKTEMSLEISRLQGKIKELQEETRSLPRFPGSFRGPETEAAETKGKVMPLQRGPRLLEENGDVLRSLQRAHERAVKENVKMSAEIIKLEQRLQKLEPGTVSRSYLDQANADLFRSPAEQRDPSPLRNLDEPAGGISPGAGPFSDESLQDGERRKTKSFDGKPEESEGMVETCSEFETSEETGATSGELKSQICQLREKVRILHAKCDRTSEEKQDLVFEVSLLKKKLKVLEKNPDATPKYKTLYEDANRENACLQEELLELETQYDQAIENNNELTLEVLRLQAELKKVEEAYSAFSRLERSYEEAEREKAELKNLMPRLQENIEELQEKSGKRSECSAPQATPLENQDSKLEKKPLVRLQKLVRERQETGQPLEELEALEEAQAQEKILGHAGKSKGPTQVKALEENAAALLHLREKNCQCQSTISELELEKRKLRELTRKLRERVTSLAKQKDGPSQGDKEDELKSVMFGLQSTCSEMQQKVELLRFESEKLQEENSILRNEITSLNEDGSISNLKLRELSGSREEMWEKIEMVRKEKVAVQKMVENLKKQVSELKTKNQQLELENADLSQKNSQNQAEIQDLTQRLAKFLWQKEKEPGKSSLEDWEKDRSKLKEELEECKVKSSALVSSLETELSKLKLQIHVVEQENLLLKEELDKMKQLPKGPDLSDFQNKISSVMSYNEKLLKEKEALSEELNRCVDKVAKLNVLENRVVSMKQEQKTWEQQSETLKLQLAASQEKAQSLDDSLKNVNLQMSRVKSDLRVSQQEREALKKEVVSLSKQLQNASDKNQGVELAMASLGVQTQQKLLSWEDLDQLIKQEQQLLIHENERLQSVVQNTEAELTHSREKVRQLESTILSPKHQKNQNSSGSVKTVEQEKLSLKRECEQFQKERSPVHRKVNQVNALEHELETIHLENEGLKKKQVKLDEQLVEMQHSRSGVTLSPPQTCREPQPLQPPACPTVLREQFLQLQQQLAQAERRNQRLQEELENRTPEANTPQGSQQQLVKDMEERMLEVEQKLKLVKRLLQEKVNQLKEQLSKNTKADEMVKDLYVENAQLLKALEMTEQRQKTAEKKNYLLEEKIASLSNIVRNLTPTPLTPSLPVRT